MIDKTSLYILQVESNHYKIGVANNVNRRIATLQIGSPYQIKLLHEYRFSNTQAYLVEKYLHTKYKSHLNTGEWYIFDKTISSEILGFTEEFLLSCVSPKPIRKTSTKFTRGTPIYARLDLQTDEALENYASSIRVSKSLAVSMAVRDFLARQASALPHPVSGSALGSPELSGQLTTPALVQTGMK